MTRDGEQEEEMSDSKRRRGLRAIDRASLDKVAGGGWIGGDGWFSGDRISQESATRFLGYSPDYGGNGSGRGDGAPSGGSGYGGGHNSR